MVLFAFLSTHRPTEVAADEEPILIASTGRPPSTASGASAGNPNNGTSAPALPKGEVTKATKAPEPPKSEKVKSEKGKSDKGKGGGTPKKKAKPSKPKEEDKSKTPPSPSDANPPQVASNQPTTDNAAIPDKAAKPDNAAKPQEGDKSKELALNTAPKKDVEPKPVPTAEGPTFPGLGPWVDPTQSASSRNQGGAIIVTVPAGIHILSPELNHRDAPMSVMEVSGDFEVRVTVGGGIKPGSKPLKDLPIAFQGAGIVLWENADNFMRLERSAAASPNQPLLNQLLIETCRNGRTAGKPVYKEISDKPVILKLTRKGDDMDYSYSPDGKTWISVKKSAIAVFSEKVYLGIVASNLSPKPFNARFENFTIDQSAAKPKKP